MNGKATNLPGVAFCYLTAAALIGFALLIKDKSGLLYFGAGMALLFSTGIIHAMRIVRKSGKP